MHCVFLSHPTMGAWIEILHKSVSVCIAIESHPTMGAWIEIYYISCKPIGLKVAPHDGCVD